MKYLLAIGVLALGFLIIDEQEGERQRFEQVLMLLAGAKEEE